MKLPAIWNQIRHYRKEFVKSVRKTRLTEKDVEYNTSYYLIQTKHDSSLSLTHFMPLVSFYTHLKHQKTSETSGIKWVEVLLKNIFI